MSFSAVTLPDKGLDNLHVKQFQQIFLRIYHIDFIQSFLLYALLPYVRD